MRSRSWPRNLTGNYWLYPSDNFGPWLSTKDSGDLFSQSQVVKYVGRIGGSQAILNGALAAHRQLDGFKKLEPFGLREYRAVVGTGVPTVEEIRFLYSQGKALLNVGDGDGTVAARSGSQGASRNATGKPLGADIPISYLCSIKHAPLGGSDPTIFKQFGDYIRYGSPPPKTTRCSVQGWIWQILNVDLTPPTRATAQSAASSGLSKQAAGALLHAEQNGLGEAILLPQQADFIADAHHPGTVTMPVKDAILTAAPVSDKGAGRTIT